MRGRRRRAAPRLEGKGEEGGVDDGGAPGAPGSGTGMIRIAAAAFPPPPDSHLALYAAPKGACTEIGQAVHGGRR